MDPAGLDDWQDREWSNRMDVQLARLLAARLCHDLGGIVAALAGTLDLAVDGDAEMLALARESTMALRQRLRLYAAAWGLTTEDAGAGALGTLLQGAPAFPRVRFALDHLAPGGCLPARIVPLALCGALLGAEALPRGGVVTLAGSAGDGFLIHADGREVAWPSGLLALLAGSCAAEALQGGPRRVLAPLLAALAAESGWSISLAQAAGRDAPPLLLEPSITAPGLPQA